MSDKNSVTNVRCKNDILISYVYLFRDAVGLDFILMGYNMYPDRVNLVNEIMESEILANEISRPKPCRISSGYSREDNFNWNLFGPFHNRPGLEKKVVGVVRLIVMGAHKLLHLQ